MWGSSSLSPHLGADHGGISLILKALLGKLGHDGGQRVRHHRPVADAIAASNHLVAIGFFKCGKSVLNFSVGFHFLS